MSLPGGADKHSSVQYIDQGETPIHHMVSINHSFTVRSIYLQPREAIPYPGTEHFPSYDFSSHPEYPIKKEIEMEEEEQKLFNGVTSFILEKESAHESSNRIPGMVPPIDVASFETVASEPFLCQTGSQEANIIIPTSSIGPFLYPGNKSAEESNQHIFSTMNGYGSVENETMLFHSNSYSTAFQDSPTTLLPSINSSALYQNNLFPVTEVAPLFNSQTTTTIRQEEKTITQSNTFYQFSVEKKPSSYPSRKKGNNAHGITPSPTCSSLGLTQMKALYNKIYKKHQRGSKKKCVYVNSAPGSRISSQFTSATIKQGQNQQHSKPTKKARTIFSDSQSEGMLRVFRQTPYISSEQKTFLSQHLEISEETISVWFKNQRSKMKKRMSSYPSSAKGPFSLDGC